ncbi:UDP-glcNAc:betaGal beta-1 3-N-acetylglucosaminyltransferase 5 [Clonorchis sinensis]|nr:UDP-glcNAc:betaGal beta-1 3-N-acetylglucosaminyltransferase 5 [Clonorchis sinensis]
MILLLYTYHAHRIQIPNFVNIQYPGDAEFYKAYEAYLLNNFNTSLQKWQNNLTLLMEDSDFCNKETPPELVVFFKTTYDNHAVRNHIRKTWGNKTYYDNSGMNTRVFFVVGQRLPNRTADDIMLKYEHMKFRDIVQFDFVDTYKNLTYKVGAMLYYIIHRCPEVNFVASFDDDFLVHPTNVVKQLRAVTESNYPIFIGGKAYYFNAVNRDPLFKWFIPRSSYPYSHALPFVSGGTVLMSMPVAKLLSFGMTLIPFFGIDDVLFGMVLTNFGISPTSLVNVHTQPPMVLGANITQLCNLISSHGFKSLERQQLGWTSLRESCSTIYD